ncbi:MAG: 4-hydroxy-tetrahydrodipicolinate synthase [Bacteroides sp.]|nr:4-hydroxy-tetrahydrodipicolinate synthase [Bacillota bacterium]MCM1393686.1 4-hydroxy-tetrahydrodipicolinate synthase [[Eubacterium] siraeum]MCM1455215.1 4-hydroxy-tetrahydrodipicolinate synthase [Bacteroides sp.]
MFKGVATALITPFTNDNKVDADSLKRLLEYQLYGGVNAVVVLGTTGEPATMTQSEKAQVVECALKTVGGKIPVIVGAGSNGTQSAKDACKFFEGLGADALLVVTPYYNKCTQDGLICHYTEIANATNLPIICYNVPGRTGVNMLPATFSRIADIDNVCAIKEASGNMEQICECLRLAEGKAEVYSGDDALTVPVMAMGGAGVISVASNAYPKYVSEMTKAFFEGDLKKASAMQKEMLPFVRALFAEVNPIPIKRTLSALGFCENVLRLPLTPSKSDKAALMN